jgi:stearoyl-CoA desaturase (delta-9 desaturase)
MRHAVLPNDLQNDLQVDLQQDSGHRADPTPLPGEIERPPSWHLFLTSFRVWAPLLHGLCLLALVTGVTTRALVLGIVLYWVRMFAMTGGYHRYFSHRSYRTSRPFQFLLGFLGTMGVERGPLWWAATHRKHHRHSDQRGDVHSPVQRGFWHAHLGWLAAEEQMETDLRLVKDLHRYPELRWLDRYHWVGPLCGLILCYLIAGASGVVVGGIWSTVALWHGTFSVNSLSHLFGSRRFATADDSRNHWLIALYTMGEGWHNNHHHFMASARQGFRWWEIDLSYYVLRGLAALGLVWDLKQPPPQLLR